MLLFNPFIDLKNLLLFFLLLPLVFSSCQKDEMNLLTHKINSGTSYQLHDIFFVDDSTGFISGGSRYEMGILLRTTDGGHTWSGPDSVFNKCAYTNFFFNASEGYVGGYDSYLAYTSDGAQTFSNTITDYVRINKIAWSSRQNGVIVGGNGYASGYIRHTADAGQTWTKTEYIQNLRSVFFADSTTAYVSGYGAGFKSTDGGHTFHPLDLTGDFFVAMDFPTTTTGYFAGYQGMVRKTTDGGRTFQKLKSANSFFEKREYFEGIDFWDEHTGYLVGHGGVMYKTTNGGDTWQKIKPFTSETLRDIHLFSATSGIVIGDNGKIFLFRK